MKQAEGGRSRGYTILETLIFLAVSGAMFLSAMALINGRQQRTEFSTAIRDFESSMNDIANDVADGYYANATNDGKKITCNPTTTAIGTSSPVSFPAPGQVDKQGGNTGCIFIGKSLQFSPNGTNNEQYAVISLVGRQYKDGDVAKGDAESYYDTGSGVQALVKTTTFPSVPDAYSLLRVGGGVTVECALYATTVVTPAASPCSNTGGLTPVDTVSFMTTFHGVNLDTGDKNTGSKQVDLVVPTSAVSSSRPYTGRTVQAAADDLNRYYAAARSTVNPAGGVFVCLQSNGTKQYALISLGGKNSRFSTSTQVLDGRC